MIIKRSWLGVFAIPLVVIILAIGAERAHSAGTSGTIDPSCTSSSPCIEYSNTSTGAGIRGDSAVGFGEVGTTRFVSTSPTNFKAGVLGLDNSTSGSNDAGVRGLSVRGAGVSGQSANGAGINGTSTSGDAVLAISNGSGNIFHGFNPSEPLFKDVFTVDKNGNVNAVGNVFIRAAGSPSFALIVNSSLNSSEGITSEGSSVGVEGDTGSTGGSTGTAGIEGINNKTSAAIYANGFGGLLFRGSSFSLSKDTFTVDDAGNVHAHSFTADLALSPSSEIRTYSTQQSEPTIEDFGEAQLINGAAYVHLDGRFASVMAHNVGYLVFVTPEGDNRGLYVTQKSPLGFFVRESQGGHSSVAFCYRIIAKPIGNTSQRLPIVLVRRNARYAPQLPRSMPQQIGIDD